MNTQFKKQQCYVAGLSLSWIGYAVGLAYFSYQRMESTKTHTPGNQR
jgi:hypothetical protein